MIRHLVFVLVAAVFVTGCHKSEAPGPTVSSKTHWLRCVAAASECFDSRAVECSEGFCLDDTADRILRDIDGEQTAGTWVFHYELDEFGSPSDEFFSGEPSIVDGCLVIGDAIVIWDLSNVETAQGLVADIAAGMTPGISVGAVPTVGVPDLIAEHCSTPNVYFGVGDPIIRPDAGN